MDCMYVCTCDHIIGDLWFTDNRRDKKNTCSNLSACEPNGSRFAISNDMGVYHLVFILMTLTKFYPLLRTSKIPIRFQGRYQ